MKAETDDTPTVRLDKWLWAARFFKHRGLATEAVEGGRVHVNGQATKPAKAIKPGDELMITIGEQRFVVEVIALADKRGPASVAQGLYLEREESRQKRQEAREMKALAAVPGGDARGRPSKQDRRRRAKFEQGMA